MATSPLVLTIGPRREGAEGVRLTGELAYSERWREPLWFEVPTDLNGALTPLADPFLLACLMQAMQRGRDLRVEGAGVSPGLLGNIDAIQRFVSGWWPECYRPIRVMADSAAPPQGVPERLVLAFSGGVDSCYTAWRHHHRMGPTPYLEIDAGVMVHGFDIPLGREADFARAFARSEAILASIGLPLLKIVTNLRVMPHIWEHTHGISRAAALSALGAGYSRGMWASCYEREDLLGRLKLGAHPDLDPLFSGSSFRLLHDSAGISKQEKVAAIKNWPEACRDLRVCWMNPDHAENCGRCEKCIRTILYFRSEGVFPSCFPCDVSDEALRGLHRRLGRHALALAYEPLLATLRARGVEASWVDALEATVARARSHPTRSLPERIPESWRLWIRMWRHRTGLRRGVA